MFDPVSEQNVDRYIDTTEQAENRARVGATQDLSDRISQIYRENPWMTPAQVLGLAKGNASPEAVDFASTQQGRNVPATLDPDKPQRGWFDRTFTSKLRAASRWTFAALDFVPEFVQGGLAQFRKPGDTLFQEGWFTATKFGTALQNPELRGEGFFMGGETVDPETGQTVTFEEKAGEKARAYRGEINGHAWTLGRGAASLVFTPGSKAYATASGLLDAVVNLTMDPTVLGGKAAAAIRTGRALAPSVKSVDEINEIRSALKAGLRTQAGMSKADSLAASGSTFLKFWQTDRRARRLVERLADPANNDAYGIFTGAFNGKIDIATATRFAEAKSTDEVMNVLVDVANRLDDTNPNLIPEDIRDIRGARAVFGSSRIPFFNNLRRSEWFTTMPKSRLVFGTAQDNTEAVLNMGRYLDTIEGGYTKTDEGRKLMNDMMGALGDESNINFDKLNETYNEAVRTLLKKEGASEDEIKTIFQNIEQSNVDMQRYFIDLAGNPTDEGLLKIGIANGYIDPAQFKGVDLTKIDSWQMTGPGTLLELSQRMKVLPDIREVRRITANPYFKKLFVSQGKKGQLRFGPAVIETIQSDIWKPIQLMTGGYMMRNMLDAQVRMAVVGKDGFFNHPLRYIQYAMGKRGVGTVTGQSIEQLIGRYMDDVTGSELDDMIFQSLGETTRADMKDMVTAFGNARRNGAWVDVSRQAEPIRWQEGLLDELVQVAKDPAMNAVAKGIPNDKIITWLRNDPTGKKYLKVLESTLKRGLKYVDDKGDAVYVKFDDVTDEVLTEWVNRLNRARVNMKTGLDEELNFALGYRQVPSGIKDDLDVNDIVERFPGGMQNGVGRPVTYLADDGTGNMVLTKGIQVSPDPVGGVGRIDVRPVLSGNDVVDSNEGRRELAELIRRKVAEFDADPARPGFPPKVKLAQRTVNPQDRKLMDRATSWFFNGIYGTATTKLEKSPLFRQFYYDYVAKEASSLSRAEAVELVDNIKRYAANSKTTPVKYVGNKKVWDAIQNAAKTNADDGLGTIKQLDDYAKLMSLDKVKTTLYNASERNNLEDIARIVAPFGVAWREVVTKYAKFLAEDPSRVRRGQLVYSGAEKFDPDGDGQGFFYKDPVSGQNSFLLPFSGELAQLVTGVNAPLRGEARRLSIGLSVTPGIGPTAQLAASAIIPDTPRFDALSKFLMPYGRKDPDANILIPSYALKIKSALFDDPNKMETIYGNTYMDTVRALSASGKYKNADGIPDEESKARLMEDAKTPAKILTIMRALGQFIGPVAPSNEFVIKNAAGQDMLASALSQEFYRMQNENYDTAVPRAIEMFGEDAFMYFTGKTEAVVGGVEPTDVFADWERSNGGFLNTYDLMGGYFAPGGDAFSFEAWDRMKRTGKIRELTPAEVWDRAQYRVGASIYRYYRDQVGGYPTKEQSAWLKQVRGAIHRRFPGFPEVPVFTVGEFELKIDELKRAVSDPRMEGNQVASAIATYLSYRDQAIQRYVQSGGAAQGLGTAKGAEPLRQWLVSIGMAIGEQVPEFQRIWDRELMNEVDK